ncbi:MAG: hypothetical protein LBR33_10570 [Propionibacteriaceae bacterium]|nr:hypothetical protein [Propionibacteriaceae bacterium]
MSIPAALRRRFKLDTPGAQVKVTVDEANEQMVLAPHVAIPADQAWYWTPEWQAGEREVDADIANGRVTTYLTDEEFLASFKDE